MPVECQYSGCKDQSTAKVHYCSPINDFVAVLCVEHANMLRALAGRAAPCVEVTFKILAVFDPKLGPPGEPR